MTALLFTIATFAEKANLIIVDPRCENQVNPMGMDEPFPRFSWKLQSDQEEVVQVHYLIRISSDLSGNNVIAHFEKTSDQSVDVISDLVLKPHTRYYWQVRIKDNKGNLSAWSKTAFFETGFMQNSWKAKWIEPEQVTDPKISLPPVLTRKEFVAKKAISSARLYITSRGLYLAKINGKAVTNFIFTPGWTSYNNRTQYQVFDISSLIQNGSNAIGVALAEGWYRGTLGWTDNRNLYGKKLGLLAEIHLTYKDGSTEIITSDETWKASDKGPLRMSGIYDGEKYDARMEINGWDSPGFDDVHWGNVSVSENQKQLLVWQQGAFVKRIQELKPVKIFKTPKGELVADMGQNMVGRMKIRLQAPKGTTIKLSHAEVLDKEGNFYTENLRAAKVALEYTCKGEGVEEFEPWFTFMGFQYVKIEGYPGTLNPDDLTGIVIHSEMTPTLSFETSHPLINQLQHNIVWGQKGNFLDVPTDCPQRDERLGWTGDAQAFIRTAAYNMDIQSFFTKWLKDLSADQYANGAIPHVVPDVLRNKQTSAGWADVAVIAPWTIYTSFGDKRLLKEQYPSMKKFVEYIRGVAGSSMIWKGGSVFGDWLYYHPELFNHTTADGHTDRDLIATAFYAYSTSLLAKSARVLGNQADAEEYGKLFEQIKEVFNKEYVSPSGRVYSGSQTSYVLALHFDLLPETVRMRAAEYLADDIRSRGNHLSTGFLGTPYICHVLTRFGQSDVAYKLLFQETFPSWLYPVKKGATTIWERWDGIRQDGSFQDKGMNSFNHYAYGAIGEWMYRVAAGIDFDEHNPGYKHIYLHPNPGGAFTWIRSGFQSKYGEIRSDWEIKDGQMNYTVVIPANTRATITLPKAAAKVVQLNNKIVQGVVKGESMELERGSGKYVFKYAW